MERFFHAKISGYLPFYPEGSNQPIEATVDPLTCDCARRKWEQEGRKKFQGIYVQYGG
jgi:hypothetical protein